MNKQQRFKRSHKFDGLPRPIRWVRVLLARTPIDSSGRRLLGDHWMPGPPKAGSKYKPHQGKKEMEKRARIPLSA